MPRLVFFLLTLGLLAAHTPIGVAILQAALSSEPPATGESPESGWGMDPDGSTSSSEESPDSGWEMDPNGSTTSSEERPDSGWGMDPNG